MMPKHVLLTVPILLSVGLSANAQTAPFLSRALSRVEKQPALEKVYLHLNKPGYDFGDTIWYKAYTVIGQHHQLSALSRVLHVDLISPKDSVVTRQTLMLISGIAWGDIALPKTLKQGNYRVRAYTNWMRNFDSDYFYDQRIRIGGIQATSTGITQTKPDVQFLPEGGGLVDGVRSRVAVKSVGTNGLGENVKGTIEDDAGNVVADFATQHLGMRVFAFTPQSGKTYKAKISTAGEAGFTVDLPKASQEGYTLALNNEQADSIFIKVAVNEKTLNTQKSSLFYIIAQNGGKIYYTTQGKLEGLVYTAAAKKSRFPTGVTQFTLFGQNGEPLAERIAFIWGNDTLKLSLAPLTSIIATRQPVRIALSATDHDNKPVTGSFSVSVTNETLMQTDENAESTILNNLLLTSDLKGTIEKPNYYFTNTNEQTKYDLDVLMLTQGYRRFEWKEPLNSDNKPTIVYPPESGMAISGTLKTPSGKPVANGKITLLATKENLLRDTTTDTNGNFKFTNVNLADTVSIVLKARKANKNDNVIITLNPESYPKIVTAINNGETTMPAKAAETLQRKYHDYEQEQKQDYLKTGIRLKQVNIHASKPEKKPELTFSSNLNGPGHADQVIMGKDVEGCVTLSDCLQGRVTGVVFTHPNAWGERKAYLMRAMGRLSGIPPPMVVIIDGMIMDAVHLDEINTKDIASIEVLRSGNYLALYGTNAPGGAFVITTKRGGEDSRAATPRSSLGLLAWRFPGYAIAHTFYTPKYSAAKRTVQVPDIRSAIYWKPNLLTDEKGKTSFSYFNNDTKGTYRVVVEGIDDEGNLGRAVFRYKVE